MKCMVCLHDFCWLCKEDWRLHGTSTGGFYKYNRYRQAKVQGLQSEEETAAQTAKLKLEKYMHYYMRFDNHSRSRDFAIKSLETVLARMGELQELRGGGHQDV